PGSVPALSTDTKTSPPIRKATADVGIQVWVKVDGGGAGVLPTSCVVYDQRFQQISSQLFSQLAACQPVPTTTACTADADCAALGVGFTCNNPSGTPGGGFCVGPPNDLCN